MMTRKIKIIQQRLENNPKFQDALSRLRPEWSFWGVAGVVLFFLFLNLLQPSGKSP